MNHDLRTIVAPVFCLLIAATGLTGCAGYTVRSTPANLQALSELSDAQRDRLTDHGVATAMNRKPLARFPAALAVTQLQADPPHARGFDARRTPRGHRPGFRVVYHRDAETEAQLSELNRLDRVRGVCALSRLVMDAEPHRERDLRAAAGRLNADLLLVYTFETDVFRGDSTSPLDVVTLGFLPHLHYRVQSTASAVLMDTRTGYIYAATEGSASTRQRANSWTSQDAADQARRRAEQKALDQMVERFVAGWPGLLAEYDRPVSLGAGSGTPQGRELELYTLANPATGPDGGRDENTRRQ